MLGLGGWDTGLRDNATETWSRSCPALDKLHRDKTQLTNSVRNPNLHNKETIAFHAAVADEEKKLAAFCQKAPADRTDDEVKWVNLRLPRLRPGRRCSCACMRAIPPSPATARPPMHADWRRRPCANCSRSSGSGQTAFNASSCACS